LMLSAHFREGIWDSFVAGKMATWIMEMEEEGMDKEGFIPEEWRCWGETFSLDWVSQTASVRCWQGILGHGAVEQTKIIEW
jgi:hypothetical protein